MLHICHFCDNIDFIFDFLPFKIEFKNVYRTFKYHHVIDGSKWLHSCTDTLQWCSGLPTAKKVMS